MLAEGDRSLKKSDLRTAVPHKFAALSMTRPMTLSMALWCWESYGINIVDIAS